MSSDEERGAARPHWQIFVSHTEELTTFPTEESFIHAATNEIQNLGHTAVEMSTWAATNRSAKDEIQRRVRACDVYVGILGHRWGEPLPEQPEMSYVEYEYEIAGRLGLPRLLFLLDNRALLPKDMHDPVNAVRQDEFRQRVNRSGVRATFKSGAELRWRLGAALRQLADDGLPPRRVQVPAPPPPPPVAGTVPPRSDPASAGPTPGPRPSSGPTSGPASGPSAAASPAASAPSTSPDSGARAGAGARPWWQRPPALAGQAVAALVVLGLVAWSLIDRGDDPGPKPSSGASRAEAAACDATDGSVKHAKDGQCIGYVLDGEPFGTSPGW